MSIVDFFRISARWTPSSSPSCSSTWRPSRHRPQGGASETNTREQWDAEVLPGLSFSWKRRSGRIDLTQRAMDEQQNQVKSEIGPADPELGRCHPQLRKLLHETGQTLRELQDTLTPPATACRRGCSTFRKRPRGAMICSTSRS